MAGFFRTMTRPIRFISGIGNLYGNGRRDEIPTKGVVPFLHPYLYPFDFRTNPPGLDNMTMDKFTC